MWAAEEIRALLPDPVEGATEGTTLGDVFMHHYGVKETGNVSPMKVRESKALPSTGSIGGRPAPLGMGEWQSSPKACGVQPLSPVAFIDQGSPFRTPIRS